MQSSNDEYVKSRKGPVNSRHSVFDKNEQECCCYCQPNQQVGERVICKIIVKIRHVRHVRGKMETMMECIKINKGMLHCTLPTFSFV